MIADIDERIDAVLDARNHAQPARPGADHPDVRWKLIDEQVLSVAVRVGDDNLGGAFGARGGPGENALVVTSNQKGGSVSYRVDEKTGALTKLDIPGTESNEAISIHRDGALYDFADAHQRKSDAYRMTCEGW